MAGAWPPALGVAAGALAVGLLACSGARPTGGSAGAAAQAAPRYLGETDIRGVLDRVAVARQLPPSRPIRVNRVDRATFVGLLREDMRGGEGDADALSPTAAFLLGFNLVPPPEGRGGLATAQEVIEQEVVG